MNTIKNIHIKIDSIDADVIRKLAQRKKLVLQIGVLKAKVGKQILDPKREQSLMQMYKTLAKENDLDFAFIEDLFKRIHTYSRELQQ